MKFRQRSISWTADNEAMVQYVYRDILHRPINWSAFSQFGMSLATAFFVWQKEKGIEFPPEFFDAFAQMNFTERGLKKELTRIKKLYDSDNKEKPTGVDN